MKRHLCSLRVPGDFAALIRGLHPDLKRKVRAALETVLAQPDCGKPLKAELAGLQSFRIGKLRLIYRLRSRRIELVAFGARERIYEETFRLISKQEGREGVEEAVALYATRRVPRTAAARGRRRRAL